MKKLEVLVKVVVMKIYLVSNNSLVEGLNYENDSLLELIRVLRPLSIKGEENALKISELKIFTNVEKIYSSFHSSAISTSKYLANKLNLTINMKDSLNDCKVGTLGSKNMKMVKGLQDHDFTYKLPNGESLIDVGNRLNKELDNIISLGEDAVIFTHKRAILGFLLKYAKVGYNLDDSLILEYNDRQVYDDTDSPYDIYEIDVEKTKIIDIKLI